MEFVDIDGDRDKALLTSSRDSVTLFFELVRDDEIDTIYCTKDKSSWSHCELDSEAEVM